MDLSRLYGPGYAGYLHGLEQRQARNDQALRGLGLLSNMQRQAEQNKLLEQQINIARLQAEKQAQMMDIQRQAIQRVMGGGQAMEPTGNLGLLREPDPFTGEGAIPLPERAPAARGGFAFNPSDIGMLALAGVPGAQTLMKGYELTQPKMEFHGGQAFNMRDVRPGTVVPQTNQQGFSTMTVPDGQGGYRVMVTPGAAEAFGTQQRISEEAKGSNPIATRELELRAAEMGDKGIRVPAPAAPTGAIQFPSSGRTQPGQVAPQQILASELAAEQAKFEEARRRGDINGMEAARRNMADLQREMGSAQPAAAPAQPARHLA